MPKIPNSLHSNEDSNNETGINVEDDDIWYNRKFSDLEQWLIQSQITIR